MVENELLPIIQQDVSDVFAVKVTNFRNGSVIADFLVIMDESASLPDNVTAMISQSITNAIKANRFTFTVDADFSVSVSGKEKIECCFVKLTYIEYLCTKKVQWLNMASSYFSAAILSEKD